MVKKSNELYEKQAEILKALAHPIRLKIIELLASGEKCVCEIFPAVKAERSNVSRHLASLLRAEIVACRKEGLKVFYNLKISCANSFLSCCEKAIKQQIDSRIKILKGCKK
ncbi:MAG: metalloregulator ArsR/SmtB family transcription factor [Candidatus Firestonebacteria bacterium]